MSKSDLKIVAAPGPLAHAARHAIASHMARALTARGIAATDISLDATLADAGFGAASIKHLCGAAMAIVAQSNAGG